MNGQRLGGLSTYQNSLFTLFYKWHKKTWDQLAGSRIFIQFFFKKICLGIHKGIKQKNLFEERGTPSHQGGVFFHANQQKLYHKKTIQHAIFGWFVNARSTDRPTNEPTKQTTTNFVIGWTHTMYKKKWTKFEAWSAPYCIKFFKFFLHKNKRQTFGKKKRVMASSSIGVSFFQNAHFHLFPVIPSG